MPHSTNSPTPKRRRSRKATILELADANGWSVIREQEWRELRAVVPNLRTDDLRAAGVQAAPPWSGVAQHTLDELEAALTSLATIYADREDLRSFCRAEVIRAKDTARIISFAANVPEGTRALKREMVQWMLVWLGDPAVFAPWIRIRRIQTILPPQP